MLIDVLVEIPESRGRNNAAFAEVLEHYAIVCRNAMRRDLERRALGKEIFGRPSYSDYFINTKLPAYLGIPWTVGQLSELMRQRGAEVWVKQNKVSSELLEDLRGRIEHYINDKHGPPYNYLDMMFTIAPQEAGPLLGKALAKRQQYGWHTRCGILTLAVRNGRSDLVGELVGAVLSYDEEQRKKRQIPWGSNFLLKSGDAQAHDKYLSLLDGTKRLVMWRFDNEERLSSDYTERLGRLSPDHPKDYYKRILALLKSDSLPERQAGTYACDSLGLDFDALDFKQVREQKLKKIRPVFEKASNMTEQERRVYVLRSHGVGLKGPVGPSWVPTLKKASLSFDSTVSRSALMLLEEVTGEYGCYRLHGLPQAELRRALDTYLKDRISNESQ